MKKVVVQFNYAEEISYKRVLKNLINLYISLPEIQMEIVVFGDGIQAIKHDSVVLEQVQNLKERGAKILLCKNTLNSKSIHENETVTDEIIDSGVAQIVLRQLEGWSYLSL